jgi:hypothetical protein
MRMSMADAEARRARSNVVWVGAALVAFTAFWLGAQAVRASTVSEPRLKVWLTLTALAGASVQVSTMSRVYGWITIPHGSVAVIQAAHRWSGRITILLGSFVFYLCVTYPFMHGFTWHRLFGFLFAATVLLKLTILRGGVDRLSRLIPYLGFTLFGLFFAQFLTRGLHTLW